MKNEKRTVFRFPFFYENEKRMRVLKIQSKTLLNMIMVVKYLNFVFHIEVKTKSIFNFSKTWNGTLGTRIVIVSTYCDIRYSLFLLHLFVESGHAEMCSFKQMFLRTEAANREFYIKKLFLKVSQYYHENTCGGVFSYEYCKTFKNTYFEEHLPMVAYAWRCQNPRKVFLSGYLNVSQWMFLPNLFEP